MKDNNAFSQGLQIVLLVYSFGIFQSVIIQSMQDFLIQKVYLKNLVLVKNRSLFINTKCPKPRMTS